jgi:hypothetical protein
MKYQVWYMKPSFFRGSVGKSPDPDNLSATHVHLKDIEADDRDDALHRMQADIWSPNGEALDAVYLVTAIGFSWLPKHEEPRR